MRRLRVLTILGFSLPAALALAGCQTLGLSPSAPKLLPGEVILPCPATSVLADAASVTKLRPGANAADARPADVVLRADMSRAVLACNFDRDANTLSVDVHFGVRVTRGPADSGPEPSLDYFVAVLDIDGNVLVKHVFQGAPVFDGKPSNVFRQNADNVVVPLDKDKRPPDFEILTGFQLSPQELAYNHAPRPLPVTRTAAP